MLSGKWESNYDSFDMLNDGYRSVKQGGSRIGSLSLFVVAGGRFCGLHLLACFEHRVALGNLRFVAAVASIVSL